MYDLLECLKGFLDNAGLSSVPVYFVSPVANSSLSHSNIYAEWYSMLIYINVPVLWINVLACVSIVVHTFLVQVV